MLLLSTHHLVCHKARSWQWATGTCPDQTSGPNPVRDRPTRQTDNCGLHMARAALARWPDLPPNVDECEVLVLVLVLANKLLGGKRQGGSIAENSTHTPLPPLRVKKTKNVGEETGIFLGWLGPLRASEIEGERDRGGCSRLTNHFSFFSV